MKATVVKVFCEPRKVIINEKAEVYYALVEYKYEAGDGGLADIIRHSKEDVEEIKIGYEFELRR